MISESLWEIHDGVFMKVWPQIPCSQLLFQSIFLRTSGDTLSFCSMAAHPRKLVFLPLKFQRGNPWISCAGSSLCQWEFLTSVQVCSLPLCDVCFQRLGSLKGFSWVMGHLTGLGSVCFLIWSLSEFPILTISLNPPNLCWLCLYKTFVAHLLFWYWDYMYLFLQLVKTLKPFFPPCSSKITLCIPNCDVSKWNPFPDLFFFF